MPHQRQRFLEPLLKNGLKFSPIIGVVGHRQVGKTTLAQFLGGDYYTLDLRSTLESVNLDPLGFLRGKQHRPVVIDECQFSPDLFPALKEHVRTQKAPGQFLLTGSVRFTSRKAIKESLTGRIVTYELLPMDWNEAHSKPLGQSILKIAEGDFSFFEKTKIKSSSSEERLIQNFLVKGGLPGVFSIRSESLMSQRFETQLDTILSRDLQLIQATTLNYTSLRGLLKILALQQGYPLDFQKLARASRISVPTLKKLLIAFEGLFLIRSLESRGDTQKPTYYLEDQGEATHLIGNRRDTIFDLERFIYVNLRTQTHYRPELKAEMFRYQTRAGVVVPLCFSLSKGHVGIMPILGSQPSPKDMGGAHSFIKAFKNSRVVFVSTKTQRSKISPQLWTMSVLNLVSN